MVPATCSSQIGNETTTIKTKAEEITKGITGDVEKVKALYQWMQDNIRYIAYEDGIAGFKPEKPRKYSEKNMVIAREWVT